MTHPYREAVPQALSLAAAPPAPWWKWLARWRGHRRRSDALLVLTRDLRFQVLMRDAGLGAAACAAFLEELKVPFRRVQDE